MSEVHADTTDANVGRVLAQKYELLRLLGKGGMGAVYEGRNQIGKRVAVKLLLKPEFAQNRELTTRFFREAQASAAVESKHVVDVYDTGVDAETGFPFIIMAYLNGEDLEHVVKRVGPLNPVAAVRIVSQAAMGLAKAHEAGIVHRDIKPANLFLAKDEGEAIVKVLDFGIAKVTGETGPSSGNGDGHALTHTGALLGTPLYMSPEQAQGLKSIDARTDIWSLGMCLYQALAGRLPFHDVDTIGKLIVAIVARDIQPLSALAPWVHPELAAVVHRALARDVDSRVPTARELIAALHPFASGSLTITHGVVVGVDETLGATLTSGTSPRAIVAGSNPSLPRSGTTAGVSSEAVVAAGRRSKSRAIPFVVAGLLAVASGVAVIARLGPEAPSVMPSAATTTSAPSATPTSPGTVVASTSAASDRKVGVLALKIPNGYTVKVDGVIPGTPGNEAAPHALDNGRLELHGEFQTKFLVAVFDEAGKRVMMQDVYLYDNKLDPETLDSTLGPVKVEKPKRRSPSSAATPTAGTTVGAAPTAPSPAASDLPARF